ncbi:MAG: hypothetical protein EOP33_01050 [Rickettsiaceae bacterium]|nr:MAG: hypothetical protein EOP33_01050 [Rickettsiaceae bacterium]
MYAGFFIIAINSNTYATTIDKATFWNTKQKGTNIFNHDVTVQDVKAAKKIGYKVYKISAK